MNAKTPPQPYWAVHYELSFLVILLASFLLVVEIIRAAVIEGAAC